MRMTARAAATAALTCLAGIAAVAAPGAHAADDAPTVVWDRVGPVGNVVDDQGNPPGSTGRFFNQMLTVRGDTYAMWTDNRVDDPYGQRNPEIMLRISGDDGRTWGPLRNISADPVVGDDWIPGLAANDNSVLVAFPTNTTGGPYPDYTTVVRVTGPHGENVTRQRLPLSVFNLAAGGSGDNYYLIGETYQGVGHLSVSRSTDDGATFGPPKQLGCSNSASGWPSIAAEGNEVVAAFLSYCDGTRQDVWVATSHDAGATWNPATNVSNAPQRENPPTVHFINGVPFVAWQTVRSQYGRTLDISKFTGGAWTTPTTVESQENDPNVWGYDYQGPWTTPSLSGTGNNLTLYPPLGSTYLTSTDDGATWSTGGTLPNSGHDVVYLHRGDHSLFAWAARDADAWVSYLLYRPAAPAAVTAELDDNTATINWVPADDATSNRVQSYTVTDQTGRVISKVEATVTTTKVRGLTYGTPYTFSVTAHNAAGDSDPATSPTVTPTEPPAVATAPAKPAKPTAVVKRHNVTVTWQAPNAHGSPITRYLVRATPGGVKKVAASTTRLAFRQLAPGRYGFAVTAVNAVGSSPTSQSVTVRVRR